MEVLLRTIYLNFLRMRRGLTFAHREHGSPGLLIETQIGTVSANEPHTSTTPGPAPCGGGDGKSEIQPSDCRCPDHHAAPRSARGRTLFKLGVMCSTGQSMPLDMVSAHKWFNIATLGMKNAVRLRNEIAAKMSSGKIAAA
jgi:uncharacterized protein